LIIHRANHRGIEKIETAGIFTCGFSY